MLQPSASSETSIINEEIGSPKLYEKKYRHPEWPGGASGVTIGVGYDVGYSAVPKFCSDWGGVIPQGMIDALQPACGLTGARALQYLPLVRVQVDISIEQAMRVFDTVDKPRWLAKLDLSLPNCNELAPDCVGALWSLIYNRGTPFNLEGDRYSEMRAIKAHMTAREYDKIPAEFRSMKRLWNNGLVGRREREAQMFERGLSIMQGVHTEQTAPKVLTRQQDVQRSAVALGLTSATVSGGGAVVAPRPTEVEGHSALFFSAIILIGFLAGAGIMMFAGRHKKMPAADPA